MKNEFYDIAFRKKLYRSLEELQEDVDKWLSEYNQLRPHSGKYCYGKTPMQTFNESKKIAMDKHLEKLYNQDEPKLEPDTLSLVEEKNSAEFFDETKVNCVGIAPFEIAGQGADYQGAKPVVSQKGVDLSDNNL